MKQGLKGVRATSYKSGPKRLLVLNKFRYRLSKLHIYCIYTIWHIVNDINYVLYTRYSVKRIAVVVLTYRGTLCLRGEYFVFLKEGEYDRNIEKVWCLFAENPVCVSVTEDTTVATPMMIIIIIFVRRKPWVPVTEDTATVVELKWKFSWGNIFTNFRLRPTFVMSFWDFTAQELWNLFGNEVSRPDYFLNAFGCYEYAF